MLAPKLRAQTDWGLIKKIVHGKHAAIQAEISAFLAQNPHWSGYSYTEDFPPRIEIRFDLGSDYLQRRISRVGNIAVIPDAHQDAVAVFVAKLLLQHPELKALTTVLDKSVIYELKIADFIKYKKS